MVRVAGFCGVDLQLRFFLIWWRVFRGKNGGVNLFGVGRVGSHPTGPNPKVMWRFPVGLKIPEKWFQFKVQAVENLGESWFGMMNCCYTHLANGQPLNFCGLQQLVETMNFELFITCSIGWVSYISMKYPNLKLTANPAEHRLGPWRKFHCPTIDF